MAALNLQTQAYHLNGVALDLSVPTAATCAIPPSPSPDSTYSLPACTPPFSATTDDTTSCKLGLTKRDFFIDDTWDLPQNVVGSVP